jgi:hypothetical protein
MKLHVNTSVRLELEELRQRLQEAEETLDAIRGSRRACSVWTIG